MGVKTAADEALERICEHIDEMQIGAKIEWASADYCPRFGRVISFNVGPDGRWNREGLVCVCPTDADRGIDLIAIEQIQRIERP